MRLTRDRDASFYQRTDKLLTEARKVDNDLNEMLHRSALRIWITGRAPYEAKLSALYKRKNEIREQLEIMRSTVPAVRNADGTPTHRTMDMRRDDGSGAHLGDHLGYYSPTPASRKPIYYETDNGRGGKTMSRRYL